MAVGATAEEPWVWITSPRAGEYAIGEVTIEATVHSVTQILTVEFLVDHRSVGIVSSEPYQLVTDVGADGAAHLFEVVATDLEGETGSASVETEPLPVGGEVTVELQQLYVAVSRQGSRVLDLQASNFEVLDNGIGQKIISFSMGDIPFTAAILIDASTSMQGARLAAACAGAQAFVRAMADLDEAKVIIFSDRMLGTSPFTRDKQVLTAELDRARAVGGTALNDYLYVALKMLEKRQGRRVVILLSDGVDSHSVLSMQDVLAQAQQSQSLIYWIRLLRPSVTRLDTGDLPNLTSMWRNAASYHEQHRLLQQTVMDSGGYIVEVASINQIESVFTDILEDLREQYVIGYYPSNRRNDGQWHATKVKVKGKGIEVRVAKGYVDL